MGRFQVVAGECNHKEIEHQLEEQFIHGLNNKNMLDKVIRELTTKSINDQMTNEDVLVWAKRVEAQRMQAVILNDITDSQRFDRVEVAKQQTVYRVMHRACTEAVSSMWEDVHQVWKIGPF